MKKEIKYNIQFKPKFNYITKEELRNCIDYGKYIIEVIDNELVITIQDLPSFSIDSKIITINENVELKENGIEIKYNFKEPTEEEQTLPIQ